MSIDFVHEPATEVTVAGTAIVQHWWGLSYDNVGYLRAKHYPKAVRFAEVWDLVDRAKEAGDVYPGTYGLVNGCPECGADDERYTCLCAVEEGERA